MAVQVNWLLKGRILYSPGSTLKEDLAERNAIALDMIEAEGEPPLVHMLIDHSNRYSAEDFQTQVKQMRYYVELGNEEIRTKLLTHPLLGWVISIATPNEGLKMAGTVSSQQRNYRWTSVATLEDALNFLQDRDTSLPDLSNLVDNS